MDLTERMIEDWYYCPRRCRLRIEGADESALSPLVLASVFRSALLANWEHKLKTGRDMDIEMLMRLSVELWEERIFGALSSSIIDRKMVQLEMMLREFLAHHAVVVDPVAVNRKVEYELNDRHRLVLTVPIVERRYIGVVRSWPWRISRRALGQDPVCIAMGLATGINNYWLLQFVTKTNCKVVRDMECAKDYDREWLKACYISVADSLEAGYSPMTSPASFQCSAAWCELFYSCRGKSHPQSVYNLVRRKPRGKAKSKSAAKKTLSSN